MEGYSRDTHVEEILSQLYEVRKGLKDILSERHAIGIREDIFVKTILNCSGPWQDAIYPSYQAMLEHILQEMASRFAEKDIIGRGGCKRPWEDNERAALVAKRPGHSGTRYS